MTFLVKLINDGYRLEINKKELSNIRKRVLYFFFYNVKIKSNQQEKSRLNMLGKEWVPMDFVTLKYFIVTAQTQHMTEAARLLNVTQPALSASIRRLEEEVGCQLFDRIGRSIYLNHFGELFLEGAIRAEQVMNVCLYDLNEEIKTSTEFLRLACSPSPTNTQLLSSLFAKGVKLDTRNIPRSWDRELVNDNLDIVLTFGTTDLVDLERKPLCSYKIVIISGTGHPLAAKASVSPAELNEYPVACNSAPHSLAYMAKDDCIAQGFVPKISFMGRDSKDILRVIRDNKHIAMMVEAHLPEMENIAVLQVKDFELYLPLYIYYHKQNKSNRLTALICKNIVEFFQEV